MSRIPLGNSYILSGNHYLGGITEPAVQVAMLLHNATIFEVLGAVSDWTKRVGNFGFFVSHFILRRPDISLNNLGDLDMNLSL